MGRTHKYLELDARGRGALGTFCAPGSIFLVTKSVDGVITLTPAAITPLASAPPVRKKRTPRRATGEPPA